MSVRAIAVTIARWYLDTLVSVANQYLGAIELRIPYNIAVVDSGGGLIAHVRMDGAWLGSVDIAINKAWTARAFDTSTEDLASLTQSGQQGFGLNTTNDSRVVIFGGGIPVVIDQTIVGAVGTSAGTVEQDIAVAEAAIAALSKEKDLGLPKR